MTADVIVLPVIRIDGRTGPRRRRRHMATVDRRPSFGAQAKAIIAMEAAAEILKPHENTIARMAREFADSLHALDPKSRQIAHLFISAHQLIEDVKAFQASAAVESS